METIQSTNPGADQRDQAAHPEPGGSECPGDGEADRAVGLKELARKDLADLAQPPAVVAEEGTVDEIGRGLSARDGGGAIRCRLILSRKRMADRPPRDERR